MKQAVYYPLILILLSIISSLGYGQSSSTTDSLPRPLERKIHWMEERGFPAREYQWNHPAVNEHLQRALAYRTPSTAYTVGGSVIASSGALLATGGMTGLMVSVVVNSTNVFDEDEDLGRYGVMMGGGLGATVGGAVMIGQGVKRGRWAQDELRTANELYSSSYF